MRVRSWVSRRVKSKYTGGTPLAEVYLLWYQK